MSAAACAVGPVSPPHPHGGSGHDEMSIAPPQSQPGGEDVVRKMEKRSSLSGQGREEGGEGRESGCEGE